MARTTGDTMAEGLQKILAQMGQLLALPDADMSFLNDVQNQIAQYLREGAQAAQGGNLAMPPGPGAPGPASASPTSALMGMGGGGMGMMAPPGGSMGIQPPNMDELNRTLGSQSQTG